MAKPTSETLNKRLAGGYIIRLFELGAPVGSVPGCSGYQGGEFRLPLAPQSIKSESRARTYIHPLGPENAAEVHGLAPQVLTISGTFGEGVFGGNDGRGWQRDLEQLVYYYFTDNYRRNSLRLPQLDMAWHDLYRDDHWYVAPEGVPLGNQDSSSPYRETYNLRLSCLRKFDGGVPGASPLMQKISVANYASATTTSPAYAEYSTAATPEARTAASADTGAVMPLGGPR